MSRTSLSLAGFQLIIIGRFWVITEGIDNLSPFPPAACQSGMARTYPCAAFDALTDTGQAACRKDTAELQGLSWVALLLFAGVETILKQIDSEM
jgi:hypothetical protein